MKDFSPTFNPKEIENKLYSFWETKEFFNGNVDSKKEPFCLILPPPNVTGNLHMGHALGFTLQDVLARYKRMKGFDVVWVPGTDHAGISTQTVVEKHLIATTGKRRRDFSREEFLAQVWQWKEDKQGIILNQLRKVGFSLDWTKLRFTMDEPSNKAVRVIFKKMYDDGLIIKKDYIVNWDPVTQTALADDEVEYEEKDSYLWFFRYPLVGSNDYITIATTRPETMLGDSAVAIAPNDTRFNSVKSKKIKLPLTNRIIPIIEDPYVDTSFGSGALKVTPAHDPNDYEIALRHNLDFINIMAPDGCINELGGEFQGMKMEEARAVVVNKMQKLGLLEKIDPYKLRVGKSYRSKAIIEPYLSKQWFVKTDIFKEKLIDAVKNKKVKIIPDYWESTYLYWINNLKDWCISRQLWWGHQIPIWYNKDDPSKMICFDGEGMPPEVQKKPENWYQDEDVLDTWFSSALWPFSVLGWPEETKELKKYYPNSVLVTGHDILFFWVARMILMGEYVMGEVPFHKTFLHGLVYGKSYWKTDSDGSISYLSSEEKEKYELGEALPKNIYSKWEKMSKSKGNIIDPLEIIDHYGTDAMRIALTSSATHARQIDLDRRRFDEYKNFANKIWNATRFILQNLGENKEKGLSALTAQNFAKGLNRSLFTLEDNWILSRINQTIVKENEHLENYQFDKAATLPYDFFWNDFCSNYIELVKPVLFGNVGSKELRENKQKLLVIILLDVIRLLHPIAPFITEEIFQILKKRFENIKIDTSSDMYTQKTVNALSKEACIIAPYPGLLDKNDIMEDVEKTFSYIGEIVRSIRNIRMEMKVPLAQKTDVYFFSKNTADLEVLIDNKSIISSLVKVGNMVFEEQEKNLPLIGSIAMVSNLKIMIPLPKNLLKDEKKRLEKEKERLLNQYQGIKLRLDNKEFLEKAPVEIIENIKSQEQKLKLQLKELENKINVI